MKRHIILSAFLLAISSVLTAYAAKVVNRTIATVNGDAILLSEFEKNWVAFQEQQKGLLPSDKMNQEWQKETKRRILEQMIDDKILLQQAKKSKVRVSKREQENGILQIKLRFLPKSAQQDMQSILQRQMESRSPEEQAAGPDLIAAWSELAKINKRAVSDVEDKFYEELKKEGLSKRKFEDRIRDQLRVVQLTNEEVRSRTKKPSKEEIEILFNQILLIMQGKKPKNISEQETADLESMSKFFAAQTGERVRARHILVRVPKDASFKDKSAASRKIKSILKKIKGGADFAEMAEKNSDDKASAERGGDLGAFARGMMVPSFEKAAFDLAVGEVSDVVETDFGYHIIKVEEKRAASKLRLDDVKNDLADYLFRSQAQKIYENYIKELRKSASIKININLDELK